MRALVTGSGGFVGRYLCAELAENGWQVTGLRRDGGDGALRCDLRDASATVKAVEAAAPEVIFHLAGQASVALSWKKPQETIEDNVLAAANLLEAIRTAAPEAKTVIVGSSDIYGRLGERGKSVSEATPTEAQTPYAVSKRAQEELALLYARSYGLRLCVTRSFNHGGAYQKEGFLLSDFCAGIARVEKGLQSALRVGNLSSARDFTHVRDIVRAYRLLAENGRDGEVYNVGSGTAYAVREILDRLCAMARCPIPVERDAARLRPSDTPVICCDHTKLTADTGWMPRLGLEEILSDTLEYWRGAV